MSSCKERGTTELRAQPNMQLPTVPEALETAKTIDDEAPSCCPSPSGQEQHPFLARKARNGQHPLCKVAMSFVALVALHVLLALSFKLAQSKSSGQYPFSSPALLVVAEAAKLVLSVYLLWQEECCAGVQSTVEEWDGGNDDGREGDGDGSGSGDARAQSRWDTGMGLTHDRLRSEVSWPLIRRTALLAALYCINNNITFLVFRIADGANINLVKSGSSFVSALMLRFALGRAISRTQWSAIGLQICGLVVAEFGATCSDRPVLSAHAYLLLLVSLVISSVCGVWNDNMLKESGASMHTINILIYAYGFAMNGAAYVYRAEPAKLFFSGFDQPTTYPVLVCQSLFGITISAVYKYSDATMKSFALSCATSILMLINVAAFGSPFTLVAAMGGLTVFLATHLYVSNPPSAPNVAGKRDAFTNTGREENI